METVTNSAKELQDEARRFAARLMPDSKKATIVALSGDLGAGKTTFAQALAAALGVQESVTSPTFVIEKIYVLNDPPFERLIHIDAYRLHDAQELEVLGWHEIANDPANLILIEWPEKVAELLPRDAIRISLTGSGKTRQISWENPNML